MFAQHPERGNGVGSAVRAREKERGPTRTKGEEERGARNSELENRPRALNWVCLKGLDQELFFNSNEIWHVDKYFMYLIMEISISLSINKLCNDQFVIWNVI